MWVTLNISFNLTLIKIEFYLKSYNIMKKSYFCLIILVFIVSTPMLFSQTKILSNTSLEKVVEPKLYSEKTVFQNVSRKELEEDFDAFIYFFTTSYVAYDEIVQNGFVLNDFILNIREKFEKEILKTSDDLIKNIYEELKTYIYDSHFSIANNNSVYCFNQKYYEPKHDLSNEFAMIKNKNSIYLRLPNFLPDFFSEESITREYFERVYAKLDYIRKTKYLIIDFRNCPGGLTDYPLLLLYSLYKGNEVVIPSEIYDAKKLESELIYRSYKSIETPITASLKYQRAINIGDKKYEDILRIASIMQIKNPKRILKIINTKSSQKIHKPAYKGKIIFLTNNKTASAAEILILLSKKMFSKNVTVIGQNTMGCLTYVDVYQFFMPNNSFAASMAFKSIEDSLKQFDCWKGEGQGIEPDVICADDEIRSVLRKITTDGSCGYKKMNKFFRL